MLLDSYAWVEYFLGSEEGKKVKKILEDQECFTCIATISEVTEWALKNDLEPEIFTPKIDELSTVLDLNEEIVESAGRINFENKKSIKNWGMLDALIYVTARFYNLKTLTRDPHFEDLEEVEML